MKVSHFCRPASLLRYRRQAFVANPVLGRWLLAGILFCNLIQSSAANPPLVLGSARIQGPAADLETGLLLLTELSCVNCHRPPAALSEWLPVRSAPDLNGLRNRIQRPHLQAFIEDPSATKPGTVMPHMMAAHKAKSRKSLAAGLTKFLFSLEPFEDEPFPEGNVETGDRYYHEFGCVACHGPKGESPEDFVPLGPLKDKYTYQGLASFLMDPLKTRSTARMPRIPLTRQEAADLAAYLMQGNTAVSSVKSTRGSFVGRTAFRSLGCASCHSVRYKRDILKSKLKPKALIVLDPTSESGCLSNKPKKGVPFYGLSETQRKVLQVALNAVKQDLNWTVSQKLTHTLNALNCLACHPRDGRGGPSLALKPFFKTTGQDMEDEGRFPPVLTGAGRKFQALSLQAILTGQGAARSYMVTRMPDFGSDHAARLTQWLEASDLTDDIPPTPREGDENNVGRNMWGRHLMGTEGLSCITCHALNGHRSLGMPGMDLAQVSRRLRPEWFRDYLISPAVFRPGTRMPSFWPDGRPTVKGNGGTSARQIDSLWVYLNELDQSRLPDGLERQGNFELKPQGRPMVFRTFMKQAGLAAIAVGFPDGRNVAFDAAKLRWALGWKGRFLDAEGTWDDRFTPLANPLGDSVFQWPQGEFDVLDASGNAEAQFRGYRLDPSGTPTFVYHIETIQIEDRMSPVEHGWVQQLKLTSELERTIRFEIAVAKAIQPAAPHQWTIDGPLPIKVFVSDAMPIPEIVNHADGKALVIEERLPANEITQWRLEWRVE